jgi:hypothetical protein
MTSFVLSMTLHSRCERPPTLSVGDIRYRARISRRGYDATL